MDRPIYVGSAQWVAATPGSRTVGLFRRASADASWEHLRAPLKIVIFS